MTRAPLVQIHHVLEASCGDWRLAVAPVADGWELEVREQNSGRKLFTGERCSAAAAKRAALDYVALCREVRQPLNWTLHW